jgi:hypothetical protein
MIGVGLIGQIRRAYFEHAGRSRRSCAHCRCPPRRCRAEFSLTAIAYNLQRAIDILGVGKHIFFQPDCNGVSERTASILDRLPFTLSPLPRSRRQHIRCVALLAFAVSILV